MSCIYEFKLAAAISKSSSMKTWQKEKNLFQENIIMFYAFLKFWDREHIEKNIYFSEKNNITVCLSTVK
jgi:hypothetical protein